MCMGNIDIVGTIIRARKGLWEFVENWHFYDRGMAWIYMHWFPSFISKRQHYSLDAIITFVLNLLSSSLVLLSILSLDSIFLLLISHSLTFAWMPRLLFLISICLLNIHENRWNCLYVLIISNNYKSMASTTQLDCVARMLCVCVCCLGNGHAWPHVQPVQ